MPNYNFTYLVLCVLIGTCKAWDTDDLEVFDVVEEVGENFYDLLAVPQNADQSAIKKAFRRLSLQLHPDKNPAPDAEVKFRQLVSVYDILRDASKRSKYNDVLENGLPDWKQAVYYYRRVRKMGLIEMSVILFIIITIGQYLVAWAAYFEKKYAIEEFVSIKSKKLQKKQKKGKGVDMETIQILPELVAALPKPTVACTLPVQICKLCIFLVLEAPGLTYRWIRHSIEEWRRRKEQMSEEEESEEEYVPVVRERGPKRRKGFVLPEMGGDGELREEERPRRAENGSAKPQKPGFPPVVSGGLWTDDDLADLTRLMKKYPPGVQERWEKIGETMRRPWTEVAQMAHKMKEDGFKPGKQEEEKREEEPKKVKTKGGKLGEEGMNEGTWSQTQQKAFEQALAAHPKGTAGDRWERISKAVPGKNREECMVRYKALVDLVKKKKTTPEPVNNNNKSSDNYQ